LDQVEEVASTKELILAQDSAGVVLTKELNQELEVALTKEAVEVLGTAAVVMVQTALSALEVTEEEMEE